MTLSYKKQSEKLGDQAFLARVNQAAVAQALVVMGEETSVAGHEERASYAQLVLHGNQSKQVSQTVLTNPNCGTGVDDPLDSDDALLFVVASNWNALANYSTNQ